MEVVYPPQEEQQGVESYEERDGKIYVIYTPQDEVEAPVETEEGE